MASSAPPADAARVANAAGTLTVWRSPTGLPLRVQIAPALLARGAAVVADELLRLCR